MERQGFLFLVSSTSFGSLTIVSFMANRRGVRQANSGAKLRAIRQQLGWSMREVHTATVALAKKHRQSAFEIAPSRLHAIEKKKATPSLWRLYTLAVVYGRTVDELLSFYGIDVKTAKASDCGNCLNRAQEQWRD